MIQRDERLAFFGPMFLDEPANGVVTTRIALLVPQPFKEPHRRMPLLRRLRLIIGENLKNPLAKRPQSGGRLPLPLRILPRLPLAAQNLADLSPRMMKPPSDLTDAHPISMSTPNPSVIVHRKHPSLRF